MMDSADPLQGWPMEDVLKKTPKAKNDLYGGLFFYIQEVLVEFCSKLQALDVNLVLLHGDAAKLPITLGNDFNLPQLFDRIEV